ncbi:hypothetical protein ACTMTJ_39330 [Phytohabitans sp. LJ34]|uniref:hypothetical protein n=1 Tax=Phytohabitans sp. LJ34 TaxID=3452217 RepID=UPI003F89155B
MTRTGHAAVYDAVFEQACRYADLVGRIRGWVDATMPDPNFPDFVPLTAEEAMTEIRRLFDKYDAEQATPGGDRR